MLAYQGDTAQSLNSMIKYTRKIIGHTSIIRKFIRKFLLPFHRSNDQYLSDGELGVNGYEVIENFLNKGDCQNIINDIESNLCERSKKLNEFSYLTRRDDLKNLDNKDKDVSSIVHFQCINKIAKSLFLDKTIQKLFSSRCNNKELILESIVAQIDDPPTSMNKRGYHVDGYGFTFKAFIYLNDVLDYSSQPFTVIPKSHRKNKIKKMINIIYNILFKKNITDISILFSDKDAHSFFAKQGTLILSNQSMVHKGWEPLNGKRRYVLVFYLVTEKDYKNRIFSLGSTNKYANEFPKNDLETIEKYLIDT
tara:strand:+ start:41 stop:964 length:924 start_codon:yes stop_codon:yes gene_type:complete